MWINDISNNNIHVLSHFLSNFFIQQGDLVFIFLS